MRIKLIAISFVGILIFIAVLFRITEINLQGSNQIESKQLSENSAKAFDKSMPDFIEFAAEKYYSANPETELDVEAILKQTQSLSLITSALFSYKSKNEERYPVNLEHLIPRYLPPSLSPGGQIPKDYNGLEFDYQVTGNGFGYRLCHQDLENGGNKCLKVSRVD